MEPRPSEGRCTVCRGRQYVLARAGDRATARVCACARDCQRCQGRGHLLTRQEETFSQRVGPKAYEVLVPCPCTLLTRRVERHGSAQIPGVLATADFEGYRPPDAAHHAAKEVARGFAFGYRRGAGGKGFILSGPVGTGKTHLLAATLSHLILEVGVEARYVEISLIYATIRRGFQEGKSGGEIIGPLSEVEVLAIDELGKGRLSAFELETLDELIARRYNAGRTTLFATNYSLAAADPRGGQGPGGYTRTEELKGAGRDPRLLCERVGERIYSRLCEMCEFVELPPDSRDHRRLFAR